MVSAIQDTGQETAEDDYEEYDPTTLKHNQKRMAINIDGHLIFFHVNDSLSDPQFEMNEPDYNDYGLNDEEFFEAIMKNNITDHFDNLSMF